MGCDAGVGSLVFHNVAVEQGQVSSPDAMEYYKRYLEQENIEVPKSVLSF